MNSQKAFNRITLIAWSIIAVILVMRTITLNNEIRVRKKGIKMKRLFILGISVIFILLTAFPSIVIEVRKGTDQRWRYKI